MRYILIFLLLCIISIGGCKKTYFEYDLIKIQESCEGKEGVNRFTNDVTIIVIYCSNGEKVRLK